MKIDKEWIFTPPKIDTASSIFPSVFVFQPVEASLILTFTVTRGLDPSLFLQDSSSAR